MGAISDRWSVYPLGKESQNGNALQDYSRQVRVPPVLNADNTKSELKNGHITTEDTALKKPPHNPMLHGKSCRIKNWMNRING